MIERKYQHIILFCTFSAIVPGIPQVRSQISFQKDKSFETNANPSMPTCKTPDGLNGICIDLFSCDSLLNLLRRKPLSPPIVNHLRKSVCKIKRPAPDVCCPQRRGKIVL